MGKDVMVSAHRLLIAYSVIFLVVGAQAGASNLVFWEQLTFPAGASEPVVWVSIPFLYTPVDSNPNGELDAEDLVQDFQPTPLAHPCTVAEVNCAVVRVWKWDTTVGDYVSWTGGTAGGFPFLLEPGEAYGLEFQVVDGHTEHLVDLVGAHDPLFEFDDCYESGSVNMRWISLPPHFDIPTSFGTPEVLDAEDLGQALGGPTKVFQVRRLNEANGMFENWVVGSVYGTPFEIDLTRGVAIDLSCADRSAPCEQCAWTWVPPHR